MDGLSVREHAIKQLYYDSRGKRLQYMEPSIPTTRKVHKSSTVQVHHPSFLLLPLFVTRIDLYPVRIIPQVCYHLHRRYLPTPLTLSFSTPPNRPLRTRVL